MILTSFYTHYPHSAHSAFSSKPLLKPHTFCYICRLTVLVSQVRTMSGVSASATPTQDGSNNTVPKNENGEGASNTASKIGNVKQAGLLHHAQSTQYDWNDLLGTDIVPPSGKKGPKKQKGNASSCTFLLSSGQFSMSVRGDNNSGGVRYFPAQPEL